MSSQSPGMSRQQCGECTGYFDWPARKQCHLGLNIAMFHCSTLCDPKAFGHSLINRPIPALIFPPSPRFPLPCLCPAAAAAAAAVYLRAHSLQPYPGVCSPFCLCGSSGKCCARPTKLVEGGCPRHYHNTEYSRTFRVHLLQS